MKEITEMKTQNIRLIAIVASVGFLLLIPFTAKKLGVGFNWSPFDFTIFGVLLLGAGLAVEFVLRLVTSFTYRLLICGAILFALFIVWAELAVGVFGTKFAGN